MKDTVNFDITDDNVLWNLLIQGNQSALTVIYKKYYALLLNYGLKYTSDKEIIKDCIHDLFIKIYNNTKLSLTTSNVRVYLLIALKNILFNKLIKQEKETELLGNLLFDLPNNDDLFDKMFPQNDHNLSLALELRKAIFQLPEHQKKVLYLRYIKNLSHKEIAEIMEINAQSSMNLANRAIQKLREQLLLKGFTLSICQILLLLKYTNHF